MLVLLAACSGSSIPEPTDETPTETGGGTTTTPTGSTGLPATGDTGADVPPPPPDLCYPEIGIPGQVEGKQVQPHAEVYGKEPTPFAVRIGLPGIDPSVSASFLWRTDLDTLASQVGLRPLGGQEQILEGASFVYGSDAGQRIHEVKVCLGLQPGTTYDYRVGGPGGWSTSHRFTTPLPPDQVQSVRIAFAGDSRGSYAQFALLLRAVAPLQPDVFVFTGDAVTVGTNQAEWDDWFRAGEDFFDHVPLVMAHGNHEGLAVHWFAQMSLPNNEQWYPMRFGPLQLLVLNDTASTTDLDAQATFIDEVFGASDAPWKVGVHHQSPYATCTRHRSNLTLREKWSPRYDANGADLVLAGHNHIYERSVPILADAQTDPTSGVTYIVTGGAGAGLYTATEPEWFGAVAAAVKHFGIADVYADRVEVRVWDALGNEIDSFALPAD